MNNSQNVNSNYSGISMNNNSTHYQRGYQGGNGYQQPQQYNQGPLQQGYTQAPPQQQQQSQQFNQGGPQQNNYFSQQQQFQQQQQPYSKGNNNYQPQQEAIQYEMP